MSASSSKKICSNAFPNEALEKVLKLLPSRSDRNAASLVSKTWYDVDRQTRSELFIANCYAISPERASRRFCGNIESVILKGEPRLFQEIESPLKWGGNFFPWLSALEQQYSSSLQKIRLKGMFVTDKDLSRMANSFPNFNGLILHRCKGFTTEGVAAIASKCKKLRQFEIRGRIIKGEPLDWVSSFPNNETHLESLVFPFAECPINFKALESLVARSPSLKKLDLPREVPISVLYRLILKVPQLTHLGTGLFGKFPWDNDDDIEQWNYASAFENCTSLISLSGFKNVSAEYLPFLYPICANILFLDFKFGNLPANSIIPIIRYCHKLQSLLVMHHMVSDEGLQAVAETCPDLAKLGIHYSGQTSDYPFSEVGIDAVSRSCRKLQSIEFIIRTMTNQVLINLSNNCPDLMKFQIFISGNNMHDHITGMPLDEGFEAILTNCKKLSKLGLNGVTENVFRYIGMHGKLIKTLRVHGSDIKSLNLVIKECPNLRKVELRRNDSSLSLDFLSSLGSNHKLRYIWLHPLPFTLEEQDFRNVTAKVTGLLVLEVFKYVLYVYPSLDAPRNDVPSDVLYLMSPRTSRPRRERRPPIWMKDYETLKES